MKSTERDPYTLYLIPYTVTLKWATLYVLSCTLYSLATTVGFHAYISPRREDPHSATCHWSSWECIPLHQAWCVPCMCYGGGVSMYHLLGCCGCPVCLLPHMVLATWLEHIISGCKNATSIATFANGALLWNHSSMSGGMYPDCFPGLQETLNITYIAFSLPVHLVTEHTL